MGQKIWLKHIIALQAKEKNLDKRVSLENKGIQKYTCILRN